MENAIATLQESLIVKIADCSNELLPMIRTQDDYDLASTRRRTAKELLRELDTARRMLTRPLDDRKKEIMTYTGVFEEALKRADSHHKNLMLFWDEERRREREEEQRKLEAALRAKAEAEAEKKALEAIKRGNEAQAEKLLSDAEKIAIPVLAPHKPITEGVSYRTTYAGRVINKAEFISWLLSTGRLEAIEFKQVELNRIAKAAQEEKLEVPGFETEAKKDLIQRVV